MELNVYLPTSTCPPASLHPGLQGHCAPTICPLTLAPNRCRGREGGRPAVVILSWLRLPAEVGKGSNEARVHPPDTESFSIPTGWEDSFYLAGPRLCLGLASPLARGTWPNHGLTMPFSLGPYFNERGSDYGWVRLGSLAQDSTYPWPPALF